MQCGARLALAAMLVVQIAACSRSLDETVASVGPRCKPELVLVLTQDSPRGRAYAAAIKGFVDGFCRGTSRTIVEHFGDDDTSAFATIASHRERPPQLVVSFVQLYAEVARSHFPEADIIMTLYDDPVVLGFAESLSRPGRKTTGYTRYRPLVAKRIEVLKEAFPEVRRVVVLTDVVHWDFPGVREEIERAGVETDTHLTVVTADDISQLLHTIDHAAADAFYVVTTNDSYAHAANVIERIAARRLPAVYEDGHFTERGGTLAIESDNSGMLERLTHQTKAILQGLPASEVPFETPKTTRISANLAAFERHPKANRDVLLKAQSIVAGPSR